MLREMSVAAAATTVVVEVEERDRVGGESLMPDMIGLSPF